jgi:hypothetical protein
MRDETILALLLFVPIVIPAAAVMVLVLFGRLPLSAFKIHFRIRLRTAKRVRKSLYLQDWMLKEEFRSS